MVLGALNSTAFRYCLMLRTLALLFRFAVAKLLHEKVPVDPPGDSQIASVPEFGVEFVDHLVGVGLGDAQLLGHFLHAHKVLCLH